MTEDFDLAVAQQETAALQKYALIKSSAEDIVSVSKIYIDMTGDIEAAMVLDELMFWTCPTKRRGTGLRVRRDGYLWLAVGRSDWWERKRITERQADRAVRKLEELGLVQKKVMLFGGKTTVHLRVIVKKFFELYAKNTPQFDDEGGEDDANDLADLYEMMGAIHQTVNPDSPNGKTMDSPNGKTINSPVTVLKTVKGQNPENRKPDLVDATLHFAKLGQERAQKENPYTLIIDELSRRLAVNFPRYGEKPSWDKVVKDIARDGRPVSAFCDWAIAAKKDPTWYNRMPHTLWGDWPQAFSPSPAPAESTETPLMERLKTFQPRKGDK